MAQFQRPDSPEPGEKDRHDAVLVLLVRVEHGAGPEGGVGEHSVEIGRHQAHPAEVGERQVAEDHLPHFDGKQSL